MDQDVYKSGIGKLITNLDRIVEFKERNILRPITLDVSPTNQCNLNCSFCSVRDRPKDEVLFLGQALATTRQYMEMGIRSVVLTGGGEPTMWEYFNQYVIRCKDIFQLKLGLITNGLKLKDIAPDILGRFDWIRVSLSGLDVGIVPDLSNIPSCVDVSLNYVWVKDNPHAEKVLEVIPDLLKKYPKISAVKIERDIFSKEYFGEIDTCNIRILKGEDDRIFFNSKNIDTLFLPKVCYMGWVKPHLDAGNQVYRCVCSAFTGRKLDPRHQMPTPPSRTPDNDYFDTSFCNVCFFSDINDFIYNYLKDKKHSNFI